MLRLGYLIHDYFQFLDDLYATGCHFWDTADRYGDSEELLGKW